MYSTLDGHPSFAIRSLGRQSGEMGKQDALRQGFSTHTTMEAGGQGGCARTERSQVVARSSHRLSGRAAAPEGPQDEFATGRRLRRVVPIGAVTVPVAVTGSVKPRLLDQVRDAIRTRHMSSRTEEAYVHWIRRYILFHRKRHPAEMGPTEITQFLTFTGRRTPGQCLRPRIRLWRRFCSCTDTCLDAIPVGSRG